MNYAQASALVNASGAPLFKTFAPSGVVCWFEHPRLGDETSAIAVLPSGGIVVDCEVFDFLTATEAHEGGSLGTLYPAIYPGDVPLPEVPRTQYVRGDEGDE